MLRSSRILCPIWRRLPLEMQRLHLAWQRSAPYDAQEQQFVAPSLHLGAASAALSRFLAQRVFSGLSSEISEYALYLMYIQVPRRAGLLAAALQKGFQVVVLVAHGTLQGP